MDLPFKESVLPSMETLSGGHENGRVAPVSFVQRVVGWALWEWKAAVEQGDIWRAIAWAHVSD